MASKPARARQALIYYKAWQRVQDYLHPDFHDVQASPFAITDPSHAPVSSQDRALTAFAQLAAIKFNCKRAMITIVGDTLEYVLAEATQSLSLISDSSHSSGDHISMGRLVMAKENGLGAILLDHVLPDCPDLGKRRPDALVVHDCLEDQVLRENDLVRQQNIRFLASVPIKTRDGMHIGAYTLIGEQPRTSFCQDSVGFMQDIAQAVFEHLLLAKGQYDGICGHKMVQGLSTFVANVKDTRKTRSRTASAAGHGTRVSNSWHGKNTNVVNFSEKGLSTQPIHMQLQPQRPKLQRTSQNREEATSDGELQTDHEIEDPEGYTYKARASTYPADIKATFARAAQRLRDSTSADGCIFFDASALASMDVGTKSRLDRSGSRDGSSTSSDTSDSERPPSSVRSASSTSGSRHAAVCKESKAGVIAASVQYSGTTLPSGLVESFTMKDSDMQHLIRKYPNGRVFAIEANKWLSSDTETSDTASSAAPETPVDDKPPGKRRHGKDRTRTFVADSIIASIPNARTAIWLPIWDFVHERWHSCAILWTTQCGQLMDSAEGLLYLKAFSGSIMAEVSRLDAIRMDRTKTTFIASVSHELRSPLHGMLGGVEFLQNTDLDLTQHNLVSSIDNCGKTLLDTIDHVLDFSKINSTGNFRRQEGRSNRDRRRLARQDFSETRPTSTFDLSVLVEDVVEAIFSGQTFRRQSDQAPDGFDSQTIVSPAKPAFNLSQSLPSEVHNSFSSSVAVTLHIARGIDWKVRSNSGALRRIIMNLFGNALKYTSAGEIQVILRPIAGRPLKAGTMALELVFKDTGKGMSARYLKEKLFKPFAQEDSFSAGTGLGLSIVHQIVESLRGKISVVSEVKKGTEIIVKLQLPVAEEISGDDSEKILRSMGERWAGTRACIITSHEGDVENVPSPLVALARASQTLLEERFAMSVSHSGDVKEEADLYFFVGAPRKEFLAEQCRVATSRNQNPTILILCGNSFEAMEIQANGVRELREQGMSIEIVPQPVAPLKIARALRMSSEYVQRTPQQPSFGQPLALVAQPSSASTATPESEVAPSSPGTTLSGSAATSVDLIESPTPSEVSQMTAFISNTTVAPAPRTPNATAESLGRIPQTDGTAQIPRPSIPSLRTDQLATKRTPFLLIVDDNDINLRLLVMLMTKNKYPYVSAVNGLEALNLYQSYSASATPVTCVLMDINMPLMDGMEATRRIRAFERERKVERPAVVVALTGLGSQSARDEAKVAGFDDFVSKPFKLKELKEFIDSKGK